MSIQYPVLGSEPKSSWTWPRLPPVWPESFNAAMASGQVVSVIALYSDDASSNPAEVTSFIEYKLMKSRQEWPNFLQWQNAFTAKVCCS